MALKPPPPPTKSEPGSFAWMDWYRSLYDFITATATIAWNQINFAGSNLADLATRLHSSLQGVLGTGQYHISATEATDVANLSAGVITDVNYITFDTTPTGVPTTTPGTLFYDSADGNQTLSLVMGNGTTTQQIGEEQFYRIKASSAITNGQVIMFTGSVGASGGLTGAPATGLLANTASYVMGVATEDIALNGWGYVTSFGLVRGINTTGGAEAWVDGQILYMNPAVAGGLTKTLPVAPNPKVIVAAVTHAASNGSLFIRPTFGGKLGDYEGDVQITSPAAYQVLQRDSGNTKWQNTSDLALDGFLTLPKTAGYGIKVDTATPTFGWRDLLGRVSIRAVGANDPTLSVYRGTTRQFQFSNAVMNESFIESHLPHDYVLGSDLYIHVHWSQIVVDTGGTAGAPGISKWSFEATYAKGHNQAAFGAPITTFVTQTASGTQYQHMIAEVQLSSSTPSASLLDSDDMEPDGIIIIRVYRDPADVADTLNQAPFLHFIDVHYQSTNMATKNKAPNFNA